MQFKSRAILLSTILIIGLSILTVVPAVAFNPDSYSQQVNDFITWETKVIQPGLKGKYIPVSLDAVGDRVRLTISVSNVTDSLDSLYGYVENNSAADRTWDLFGAITRVGAYNSSVGMDLELYLYSLLGVPYIAAHNETAINASLYTVFYYYGDVNYNWSSGLNGYDGVAVGYGGDLNTYQWHFKYNMEGKLEYRKIYNNTGSGLELIYHIALLEEGGKISGFLITPLFIVLCGILVVFSLKSKKTPDKLF